jgi:hypothetical protein
MGRPVIGPAEYLAHGLPRPILLVCSLARMDNCPVENFDLAVVTDARPLRGIDGRPPEEYDPRDDWQHRPVWRREYRLLRHWNIPAFGFVPRSFRIATGEERRLWALFSRTIDLGGVRPARVEVVAVRGPRPIRSIPDPDGDPVGYKRLAIWNSNDRNRVVAEHAARLANGGGGVLPRLGTEIAAGGQLRVVVLVESPAHADRLAALLPGWAVRRDDSHSTSLGSVVFAFLATGGSFV